VKLSALVKGEGRAAAVESEDRLGTPLWLDDVLQDYFGKYSHDLAAERWSALAPVFITKEQDLFRQVGLRVRHGFGNWPYGKGELIRFVPHARAEVVAGRWREVTQLVPHYTADGWWQYVTKPEGRVLKAEWRYDWLGHPRLKSWTRLTSARLIIDVIAIAKRLEHRYPPRYMQMRSVAPFSSAVVRFMHPEAS
jgi:hypothetical protein